MQRAHLVSVLEADGDIRSSARRAPSTEAIDAVARHRPDVVTLDLQIPGGRRSAADRADHGAHPDADPRAVGDGARRPVGAGRSRRSSAARWSRCPKPPSGRAADEAHAAPHRAHPQSGAGDPPSRAAGLRPAAPQPAPSAPAASPVVAIAASTGGPAALATVLAGLAGLAAPVLVVQHLHADFVDGFATWMNRVSALPVVVAEHGQDRPRRHVYIAPGDVHLRLGAGLADRAVGDTGVVHRPSADELFRSVAEHAGADGDRRRPHRHGRRRRARAARDRRSAAATRSPRTRRRAPCSGCRAPPAHVGAVQQFLDPERHRPGDPPPAFRSGGR